MTTIFTLKCVQCKKVEKRPAENCTEMPFCDDCYMPMTLGMRLMKADGIFSAIYELLREIGAIE